ncbi:MAG: hypothetical protein WCD25_08355 [Pseudolabrys sp.]
MQAPPQRAGSDRFRYRFGFSSQSTGEVTPQKLIVLRKASVVAR